MKKSLICLLLIASFSVHAGEPKSSFSPEQLERSVAAFCRDINTPLSEKNKFSEEDIQVMSKEISDQITYSEPERFNDIIGHMMAEYYHHPQHRACLGKILTSMFTPNENETKAGQEASLVRSFKSYQESAVEKVFRKVFFAFTVAYTFEFGRGLWKTRGSGLKGIELFGSKVKLIGESYKAVGKYPWTMKAGVAGVGAGVGFAEVIYDSLQTKKVDPRPLLSDLQRKIIADKAKKMAEVLKELRALDALDFKVLLSSAPIHRATVYQSDVEVMMADRELMLIYDEAAQFRGELTPVIEDMKASKDLMKGLMRKLGPGEGAKPSPSFDQDLSDDDTLP